MKIKVEHFLIADNVIIDEFGKASIIGIYDRIFTTAVPAVHPKLQMLLKLAAEDLTKKTVYKGCFFEIEDPDGIKNRLPIESEKSNDIEFNKERTTVSINSSLHNIILEKFGKYKVNFCYEKGEIASVNFLVVKGDVNDARKNVQREG